MKVAEVPVRKFVGTETTLMGTCENNSLSLMEYCKLFGDGDYLVGMPEDILLLKVRGQKVTFVTPIEERQVTDKAIGGKQS